MEAEIFGANLTCWAAVLKHNLLRCLLFPVRAPGCYKHKCFSLRHSCKCLRARLSVCEGNTILPSCICQEGLNWGTLTRWLLASFRPLKKLFKPQIQHRLNSSETTTKWERQFPLGNGGQKYRTCCPELFSGTESVAPHWTISSLILCCVIAVLTAGDDVAFVCCLRFCLCIRMELL